MRQLLDLARENAALKSELARIREEAEMLQRFLSSDDSRAHRTSSASETPHGTD
jgi:predicted component of type VI protein secretion system